MTVDLTIGTGGEQFALSFVVPGANTNRPGRACVYANTVLQVVLVTALHACIFIAELGVSMRWSSPHERRVYRY